jgi:hypothetical protein
MIAVFVEVAVVDSRDAFQREEVWNFQMVRLVCASGDMLKDRCVWLL